MAAKVIIAVTAILAFTALAALIIQWLRERDEDYRGVRIYKERRKEERTDALWEDDDPDTMDESYLTDKRDTGEMRVSRDRNDER